MERFTITCRKIFQLNYRSNFKGVIWKVFKGSVKEVFIEITIENSKEKKIPIDCPGNSEKNPTKGFKKNWKGSKNSQVNSDRIPMEYRNKNLNELPYQFSKELPLSKKHVTFLNKWPNQFPEDFWESLLRWQLNSL